MTEPKNHRNPVTAFFRGLYAELAFSGESLRINGVGLLIGGLMIPFLALNVLGHASGSESSVAFARCTVVRRDEVAAERMPQR